MKVIKTLEEVLTGLPSGAVAQAVTKEVETFAPTKNAWTTEPCGARTNRLAAVLSKRLADKRNVGSNVRVSSGVWRATKPCSVWKHSGAMAAGTCYSLTPHSTLQETELRPIERIVAKEFDVTSPIVWSSCTLDENLHVHINGDLADDVGRESDTS